MTTQSTLPPATWQQTLTAGDRRALTRDGFLLIPSVVGADALEAMRAAWVRRMAEPVDTPRGNNDGPSGLEKEAAFRLCLEHPYVMSAIAHVLDGDVALLSFRGRNPNPGSGQQGFHVDSAGPVPPDRQILVNAFWMLDDMDESNGATRLIPGSHRLARIPHKGLSQPDAQHPGTRSIHASAGDVLVFSAHLWHAGSKNHSGALRRIAMVHFSRRAAVESYARMVGTGADLP